MLLQTLWGSLQPKLCAESPPKRCNLLPDVPAVLTALRASNRGNASGDVCHAADSKFACLCACPLPQSTSDAEYHSSFRNPEGTSDAPLDEDSILAVSVLHSRNHSTRHGGPCHICQSNTNQCPPSQQAGCCAIPRRTPSDASAWHRCWCHLSALCTRRGVAQRPPRSWARAQSRGAEVRAADNQADPRHSSPDSALIQRSPCLRHGSRQVQLRSRPAQPPQ